MKIQNTDENEEILQSQRETFVASVSHDLKNPTIAQIRVLELFLKGKFGKIPDKQKEILQMVLDSCKYMNSMLCSLLTTYRSEKGTIKLSNDEVSITDLASECIDEIIFLAKDKDVTVTISDTSIKNIVWGDRVQLKRVVMNLLTNGIKYSYKNSLLKVLIYNENNYTCFCFENHSPYISPEKQEKIFARYVSYANAHQEFGIGLGLYASKKIVEAHNGEIFVKSFKEEKNIFGFKIPNDDFYRRKIRKVTF